jgi:pimeloyl-ACP methyl ester carboxylesterase
LEISQTEVEFQSGTDKCRGWFFARRDVDRQRPCIVMAHGLGLTRRCGLREIAVAFAEAGYCVVVFDYRGFGDSDGEPRQVISFRKQLLDWAAALAFARSLPEVDERRLVTWGFSLGGGHAMRCGARDGEVSAIVAVGPMFSGLSSTLAAMRWWNLLTMLRIAGRGLLDLVAAALRLPPVRVPLAASPGRVGLLTSPDARRGYEAIVPEDFDYGTAGRIALYFWTYHPGRSLRRFDGPVLLLPSVVDQICPSAPTLRQAGSSPRVEVAKLGCDHMDMVSEAHRREVVGATLAFLGRHVPPG